MICFQGCKLRPVEPHTILPAPSRWCLVDGGAAVEAQQLLGPRGLLPAVVVRQLAGGPHLTQGGCALEAL